MTMQEIKSERVIEDCGAHDHENEGSGRCYRVDVTAVTYHRGQILADSATDAQDKALTAYRAGWLGDQMIEDLEAHVRIAHAHED